MRKIFLFMLTSIDGFFEGPNHDLSWHNVDEEFNTFAIEQLNEMDTLLFGRKTYELMESYWPTDTAIKDDPIVSNLMNNTPKIVFSKTLNEVKETKNWKNARLLHEVNPAEINELKNQPGKNIGIIGSNNLGVNFIENVLLDEVRILLNPITLSQGTPVFHGLKERLHMKLLNTRKFSNGNILLYYQPAKVS